MTMKITERLKAEHGVFLFQLDHLESLIHAKAPMVILEAVVETIATAEEHHAAMEDKLLYPALVKAIGRDVPLLLKSEQEHEEVRKLAQRVRSGAGDEGTIASFAAMLRKHLEREIHDIFALADEMVPAEDLTSMSNWDVDHLYEANARRPQTAETWLG
jgi:hemerythrin-like domain-containing protein